MKYTAAAVAAAVALSGLRVTPTMALSAALSVVACLATSRMTLAMRPVFIKARLFGIDLNKPGTKRDQDGALVRPIEGPVVPEAMGAIAGTVYLACLFAFIPVPFLPSFQELELSKFLSKFLCALLAICAMCFLGFADNVLDLRWRDKLWLPLTASLPLLTVYTVDGGGTTIVVPPPLAPLLGGSVDIGAAYYLFMGCLAIFCTNAINILAGVNGLEAPTTMLSTAAIPAPR